MLNRAHLRSLSDVDIRLVRIFITVTECGGFAASEVELNIGRSTISKHISDLELRIGLKLCNHVRDDTVHEDRRTRNPHCSGNALTVFVHNTTCMATCA